MATENSLQTQCQACGKTITFLKGRLGESWPCPHCGEETLFKPKRRKTAPQKRAEPPDPPCTLYVPCPKCGGSVVFEEDDNTYQCSKCTFSIPAIVAERRISAEEAEELLAEGTVGPLGPFVGEDGEVCSATLSLDDNLILQFEPEAEPDEDDSTSAESQGSEPPRRDCQALMRAASKSLFRQNAFRITGLAVDASTRHIAKQADRLRLMQELGRAAAGQPTVLPLDPAPTLDQIRDAIQKLKDPESRIVDEFFWFWPEQFGKADTDAALQALARSDTAAALGIWGAAETNADDGVVARHNLAVFWHLSALDAEHAALTSEAYDGPRGQIESYWHRAFGYWETLLAGEALWNTIGARIRQLDDARLSLSFASRLRAFLPEAFDKINAELALAYAEAGETQIARFHIEFLKRTNQGLDDVEKTFEALLAPARIRLAEHLKTAKQTAEDDPSAADDAAGMLISHARPLLNLFDLFHGEEDPTRNDLFDEVAAACLTCAVAHQRHSHDNKTFISLLEQALNLATSPDLQRRIGENIHIGKSNLAHTRLEPFRDALRAIENSSAPLREKLVRLRDEILRPLKGRETSDPDEKEAFDGLFCQIAVVLRGISVDLHNQEEDTEQALVAIDLAREFARDPDLQKRIAEDTRQLRDIKQKRDAHNLRLQIRDDQVEIDAKKVRYNSMAIPEHDVTGVRFGVFRQYVNGVNTSTSYLVGLTSTAHGSIQIECKRFFRSEDQAKQDFSAILDSLFYHIIPSLVSRIAKSIAAGHPYSLGDCVLTREGIRASVGVLLWKEDVLIPWSDIRFGTAEGQLNLRSSQNRKFSKSYALRDAWNAVIFEYIVKTLMEKRA